MGFLVLDRADTEDISQWFCAGVENVVFSLRGDVADFTIADSLSFETHKCAFALERP